VIVIDMPLGDPGPIVPHPDLVAANKPTPAQVFSAAQALGWFPCEPFLRPAVPVSRQEA